MPPLSLARCRRPTGTLWVPLTHSPLVHIPLPKEGSDVVHLRRSLTMCFADSLSHRVCGFHPGFTLGVPELADRCAIMPPAPIVR